jgi:hypothetical protein
MMFGESWEKTGVGKKQWATGVKQNQRLLRIYMTYMSVDVEKPLSRDLYTIPTVGNFS